MKWRALFDRMRGLFSHTLTVTTPGVNYRKVVCLEGSCGYCGCQFRAAQADCRMRRSADGQRNLWVRSCPECHRGEVILNCFATPAEIARSASEIAAGKPVLSATG